MKMDLIEIVDWMHLAHKDEGLTFVNTIMNLRVP
jgi:hypothetical protein